MKNKKAIIDFLFEKENLNYEEISKDINESLLKKIKSDNIIKNFIETNSYSLNIFSIFIRRKIGEKDEQKFLLNCCPNIIGENFTDGYYRFYKIIKSNKNDKLEFYLNILITGIRN